MLIFGQIGSEMVAQLVKGLNFDGICDVILRQPAHHCPRAILHDVHESRPPVYTSRNGKFVGGKVEPGETKKQALIREFQEELAVTISVGNVFMEVDHDYPDLNIHLTLLTLFNAAISEGIPQMLEHHDIRWITLEGIFKQTQDKLRKQ